MFIIPTRNINVVPFSLAPNRTNYKSECVVYKNTVTWTIFAFDSSGKFFTHFMIVRNFFFFLLIFNVFFSLRKRMYYEVVTFTIYIYHNNHCDKIHSYALFDRNIFRFHVVFRKRTHFICMNTNGGKMCKNPRLAVITRNDYRFRVYVVWP